MEYIILAITIILAGLLYKEHTKVRTLETAVSGTKEAFDEIRHRLSDLEKGLVPDYDSAVKAVNAVNDFNTGLNNLLGFDEMAGRKESEGD